MSQKWIELSEQKPDVDGTYLTYSDEFGVDAVDWFNYFSTFAVGAKQNAAITHWMSPPEPPRPKGPFNFTGDMIEYTENGKVVAVLNVLAPAGWAMKDIIEWVNEMLATANLEDSPKLEGPFSWRDSDRRALLFRKGGFPRDRIELTLVVPEIAALRDWLNTIWALHKP